MRNLAKEKVKFLSKLQLRLRLCWPATRLPCHAPPCALPPPCSPIFWLVVAPGLAPSFCFRSFVCGADCVARAMALLAVSNVLAAVSESRGQQPSQAAAVVVAAVAVAVAVAVAAATFHQCQLGIKLQTFTYGNFNWPLDEKSPLRRCHFATLSLLIFIFHIATRCSTGFLCYVIAVVVAVLLLIDHLFSWSLLIPLHPPYTPSLRLSQPTPQHIDQLQLPVSLFVFHLMIAIS